MRILIVDDQPADRQLAAYLLRAAGHEVAEANSGAEALRHLSTDQRPDIVASDLCMPGSIDGFELVTLIRDDPQLIDLRVVAITGHSLPTTTADAATRAGFDAYLKKPLRPGTFAAAVVGSEA